MRFSHSIFVLVTAGGAVRCDLSKIEKKIYPCAPAHGARPISIFPKKPLRGGLGRLFAKDLGIEVWVYAPARPKRKKPGTNHRSQQTSPNRGWFTKPQQGVPIIFGKPVYTPGTALRSIVDKLRSTGSGVTSLDVFWLTKQCRTWTLSAGVTISGGSQSDLLSRQDAANV